METRKRESDLGGVFFEFQLRQLRFGVYMYWMLMVGICLRSTILEEDTDKDDSSSQCSRTIFNFPVVVSFLGFILWLLVLRNQGCDWETLPLDYLVEDRDDAKPESVSYVQPEIREAL